MNSQHASQNDGEAQGPQEVGVGSAGTHSSGDAGSSDDPQELTQAARSVMHPETHDPEWRYYHGAARG